MKKPILFGLIAFVISAAATTFVRVRTGSSAVAATADSVRAVRESAPVRSDGARSDSVITDSARAAVAAPRDSVAAHDSTAATAAADTTRRTDPAGVPLAGPVVPRANPADIEAKGQAYKQVARVLSSMKPPEAAKVLALLSDAEVEGILRAVGPRQAADFLTNLPKDRAAALSRRLLVPRPNGASR